MRYTDLELEQLLGDVESEIAERKESWSGDAPDKGRQAVCAFANDMAGSNRCGVLFVGVRDNGTPCNLPITDRLLLTLADMKTDGNILPPPTLLVEKRHLKGADVAVVTVHPADAPPVSYKGRIWIRTGPRRVIASSSDERILNEKRRNRDLPFDLHSIPSASLNVLDRSFYEGDYLPAAVAPEILAANGRSYEERLSASRMIVSREDAIPTVLGMLVLGRTSREWLPGAYVQFLRIRGQEYSDPVMDETIAEGRLDQVMRRIDEKIDAHLTTSVDLTSGVTEQRTADYPRAALQQLIRNAVLHRTYEHTNAPVRVYWFSDRIEIHSPGGPFGMVNRDNFGQPGITDYRNPHVAEAMKILGFVQRFGMGISIARDLLRKNGNPPPEFEVDHNRVLVIVRGRRDDRALVLQFDAELELPEPWRFSLVHKSPAEPWRNLRQQLSDSETLRQLVDMIDEAILHVTREMRGRIHLFGMMPYTVGLLVGRRLDDQVRGASIVVDHLQEGQWVPFSSPEVGKPPVTSIYVREDHLNAIEGADIVLAIEGARELGWGVLTPLMVKLGAARIVRLRQRNQKRLEPPLETSQAIREVNEVLSKIQSEWPSASIHLVTTAPVALVIEIGRMLSPTVFRSVIMHEYVAERAEYLRTVDVMEASRSATAKPRHRTKS
ncbi:MAG TPA: ATP-binding protein [Polyangium sp.]|nr:ATP-binding protein [Polyangium sp.]